MTCSPGAHTNVVVVTMAAKRARIVWAVLRNQRNFDPGALVATCHNNATKLS